MNYDFQQLLEEEKSNYERKGKYCKRIAGDVSEFRYPQFSGSRENFEYNSNMKVYFLKRNIPKTIEEMAANEITLYELLNQKAKRLHLYDFFGYKATSKERYEAYKSVLEDYHKNQKEGKWDLKYGIEIIIPSQISIREEFEALRDFINKSKYSKIYFCRFKNVNLMFQFGSTLKGTNIVLVDDSKANFCQELFHAIYHLEEGIPGVNDDNMNIVETWADVDALYAKQLLEGRIARRVRKNNSPHDIKFLDYVFLRAYIGQAFLPKGEEAIFHSAYALIEPTMKLLVDSMDPNIKARNSQIVDGICYDKTDQIKEGFNRKYGDGAYEKIFYDFNLFHRMNTIREICDERKISFEDVEKVMFSHNSLLPTIIDIKVVRAVWLNPKINQNKDLVIDLIEEYSEEARKNKFVITMEKWLLHIKEKFGWEQYENIF